MRGERFQVAERFAGLLAQKETAAVVVVRGLAGHRSEDDSGLDRPADRLPQRAGQLTQTQRGQLNLSGFRVGLRRVRGSRRRRAIGLR